MCSSKMLRLWQLLLVAALAGCGNRPDAQSIYESRLAANEIRRTYQRINPENRVGVVIATLPDENLAAVGDIAIQDFGIGDLLVFMDTKERPLGSGRVINVTHNALHVRYRKPADGRREVRAGDLAVRIVTP